MDVDPQSTGIAGILAAAGILILRWALAELKLFILASHERSRIRAGRQRSKDGDSIPPRPAREVSTDFETEETTDIDALMTIERKRRKTKSPQPRRPGERKPRPGTHHD